MVLDRSGQFEVFHPNVRDRVAAVCRSVRTVGPCAFEWLQMEVLHKKVCVALAFGLKRFATVRHKTRQPVLSPAHMAVL